MAKTELIAMKIRLFTKEIRSTQQISKNIIRKLVQKTDRQAEINKFIMNTERVCVYG